VGLCGHIIFLFPFCALCFFAVKPSSFSSTSLFSISAFQHFLPELTGRENIFLNGAILGMRNLGCKQLMGQGSQSIQDDKIAQFPAANDMLHSK